MRRRLKLIDDKSVFVCERDKNKIEVKCDKENESF